MATLRFARGTLEITGLDRDGVELPPDCRWDERSSCWRSPARCYADVARALHRDNVSYQDEARAYVELDRGLRVHREPRPFQVEALDAWRKARGAGVVVLPTGAGKSHV